MRILVVLGEGGHTRQMIRLLDELGAGCEYHYLIAAEDELSESKIRMPGPVWRVGRPRNKVGGATELAARVRVADSRQPGAALADHAPGAARRGAGQRAGRRRARGCGRQALGARVIYVESASRVTGLSASGRMVYRLADLFIVQWPQLTERYPRAVYAGRLV